MILYVVFFFIIVDLNIKEGILNLIKVIFLIGNYNFLVRYYKEKIIIMVCI